MHTFPLAQFLCGKTAYHGHIGNILHDNGVGTHYGTIPYPAARRHDDGIGAKPNVIFYHKGRTFPNVFPLWTIDIVTKQNQFHITTNNDMATNRYGVIKLRYLVRLNDGMVANGHLVIQPFSQ